jgi:transposase
MVSAIDNRGHMAFKMFEGSFTSTVFIDFMRRLVKQAKRKVFLIVDNLRVHSSSNVLRWVKQHARGIRLFYLPKYSPDLNPDEYLNNDVKSNAAGRRRARDKSGFKANISAYLRSTQKQPEIVKRLFQERHVRYAAV